MFFCPVLWVELFFNSNGKELENKKIQKKEKIGRFCSLRRRGGGPQKPEREV